jgi:GTP pyrophosphokinase
LQAEHFGKISTMKHSLYQSDISDHSAEHVLEKLCAGLKGNEAERLALALRHAVEARDKDTVRRPRGIDVAAILRGLKVDMPTLEAALLSDPWLRENLDEATVAVQFGDTVHKLVRGVNWLNTFNEYTGEFKEPEQAELLRRMLLAVVDDVRAVLIKLAYRVQRLRMMKHEEDMAIRHKIAKETLDIFAPLANRLGVGQLKWELEDLAFRYLEPDEYKHLAKSLAANRAERERFIHQFIADLEQALKDSGVQAKVYGRPKHLYSIWKKLRRKQIGLEDLYDLHAVRVMVDKLTDCYAVLGLVHSLWLHVPKEFDDYIANPKDNGYQSLHTVVVADEGKPVEIQIRTGDMHAFAEYGVAAHWRYKEGGGRQDEALDRSINSLRRLLESKGDDKDLLEDFQSELFADQIFVLTPKGEVVRLKKGATPVDFAYAIHSEVGHRCRGAKVNGRIAPLTYQLKSGEKVEILTTKQGGPSLNWLDPHLGYVYTSHARGKIKQWFKQQDHERHHKAGKAILDRERHKLGMSALKDAEMEELVRHFHQPRADDLLLAIGRGDVTSAQLAVALKIPEAPAPVPVAVHKHEPVVEPDAEKVTVQGIRNLMMHFAHCCNPTPGTPIVGYVTQGHGVAIHAQDCPNVIELPANKQGRLIDVDWGEEQEAFPVEIEVRAFDRKGLLKDVANILAQEHINILRTNTHTNTTDQSVVMDLTLEVQDLGQLSQALDKIEDIHNVLQARRTRSS